MTCGRVLILCVCDVQYVNSQPASRLDVLQLQEALDQRLMQRQARESGICPVREQLYAQTLGEFTLTCTPKTERDSVMCVDELIRQVTINCPERGLLLLQAEQGQEDSKQMVSRD
eukprot:GHVS01079574.1.p4 GENE.GHVS01079574.1~~GHVS01079574.1.p4  ORF type:complete len:115 (-),score=16.11 GHVS01079574.1:339-683(-)